MANFRQQNFSLMLLVIQKCYISTQFTNGVFVVEGGMKNVFVTKMMFIQNMANIDPGSTCIINWT